jgi:hypothetical protein
LILHATQQERKPFAPASHRNGVGKEQWPVASD